MKATIPLLVLLGVGSLLQGQETIPLLENWPFSPPGVADSSKADTAQQNTSLGKLQLRGITSLDGEYIFSVYNPDTRESKWISQGEEEDGLIIKSFDAQRNTVVIHSESENLSRQMNMNDYSAPTGIRAQPAAPRPTPQASATGTANRTTPQSVSPTGTLTRTQQSVQRPTRRNLETLRARRAELAEKLRKQPQPSNPAPGGTNQANQGSDRD